MYFVTGSYLCNFEIFEKLETLVYFLFVRHSDGEVWKMLGEELIESARVELVSMKIDCRLYEF